MKFRTYLTIIVILIYLSTLGLIDFFHSPLAGAANAQQATDTLQGYSIAKFIAGGYIYFYLKVVVFGFLALVWIPFWFFPKKTK